jgi:hypothetical protein
MVLSREERKGGDGKEAWWGLKFKKEKNKRRKLPIRTRRNRTWDLEVLHYLHLQRYLAEITKVVNHEC